jgi:hypothetical protein
MERNGMEGDLRADVALFLGFGAGSVGFWAYFRYTKPASAARS